MENGNAGPQEGIEMGELQPDDLPPDLLPAPLENAPHPAAEDDLEDAPHAAVDEGLDNPPNPVADEDPDNVPHQVVDGNVPNLPSHAINEDPNNAFQHAANIEVHAWTSKWLQIWRILPMAFLTIALVATIVTLAEISRKNQGITNINVTLETVSVLVGAFNVGIGLLWTTLPVILFNIYGLVLSAIVRDAAARQPYVELRRYDHADFGALPEKSILLDYASYWAVQAPLEAFRNRHFLLAYSFSISLIVSTLLGGLASHIVYASTVLFEDTITIENTYRIDELGLTYRDTLVPTMDIAASTLIYGGKSIPWTTANTSIVPFKLPQVLDATPGWNLTANVAALSAQLDCNVLDASEFELLPVTSPNGTWYVSFRDRGCSAKQVFTPPLGQFYVDFLSAYWFECDLAAYYGRVVLVAAQKSNTTQPTLTNKICVSCIPSYYNLNGILEATADSSSSTGFSIRSFTPAESVRIDPYPVFGFAFARQLTQPTILDNTASLFANDFGSLIYFAAKGLSPSTPFSGETLLNATTSLYIGAFAIMAQSYLMKPGSSKLSLSSGTTTTARARLVAASAVAYSVVGILVAILIMLGCIYWYTAQNKSILYEPPIAIVGVAGLLRNSRLMEIIEKDIDADAWKGRVALGFVRTQKDRGAERGWRVDNCEHPSQMRLVSTMKTRR